MKRTADDERLAESVATDRIIAAARERHPVTSRWPAWIRRS